MLKPTTNLERFTAVRFHRFKALRDFQLSLSEFNILVGPNNAGKSTVMGAFRILAEAIRKAQARKPEPVRIRGEEGWGYRVQLEGLPVATENVFSDYDESEPAWVEFQLSNSNVLKLVFPERGSCFLFCRTQGRPVRSPSDYKRAYPASLGFVPVLGPVDHNEPLYQKEAARLALLSSGASRNFRNIWYHYDEEFHGFRDLVTSTWPGMDVARPEVDFSHEKPLLRMFCPEERIPREIYWSGFGFQVWCQMLTYIVKSGEASLLIVDEPDIYLHSDLQRQLIGLLKAVAPDILIATHSTEMISEADPDDLIVINKRNKSGRRIKNPAEVAKIFSLLGSNLNPTLTQLAKTRRVVFVEGKDFQIISLFARKIGRTEIANRTDFAVVPVDGFNPQKVKDFSLGMEQTLGVSILKGAIFDRDFRTESEIQAEEDALSKVAAFGFIHRCKELENYLLVPKALERAAIKRIGERNRRNRPTNALNESMEDLLRSCTESLRHHAIGQFMAKRPDHLKQERRELDQSTAIEVAIAEFESVWADLHKRLCLLSGKEVLAQLNRYLQETYSITLTATSVIGSMTSAEIPSDMKKLIMLIEDFRKSTPT